jgi:hypothetical protein
MHFGVTIMDFTFVPVANFVQADSQQPNPAANGIYVAPAAAGLMSWAIPVGPILSGTITANFSSTQGITLSATTGITNGVSWQLAVGQTLVLDPNTPTQEAMVITSVNTTTNVVTGIIRNNHSSNRAIAFFLDQQRSAMSPDGFPAQGVQLVALAAIDPVSGNRYSARTATTDGLPATNATVVSTGLVNPGGTIDRLRTDGAGRLSTSDQDLLAQILIELRTMSLLLAEGLNTQTDPDDYRSTVSVDYPLN